ncbi:hypothetical protein [Aurantimonas sp. HBX-1]|uniref:hypothetical protein n=1 Tax=Aurantimonas sp. HBX-1 TaxID=2906072 RepID=UPI001F221C5F|nr:hypothetical protein [Aurantimonas sp. HBX-1]UIJ73387.1 hypothetical protein LXB15_07055 [Aurantimonas sp. HBX-1]
MKDSLDEKIAQLHVALNRTIDELAKLQTRQMETSDLLIDASNSELSLDDVSELQIKINEDQKNIAEISGLFKSEIVEFGSHQRSRRKSP